MKTFLLGLVFILSSCQKQSDIYSVPSSEIEYRTSYIISGYVKWEHDDVSGVKDVTVTLSGVENQTTTTDVNGYYSFIVSSLGNYTITPSKNINLLNGVNLNDALDIQKHLTNIQYINDPYKRIAADLNKDNRITTVDAAIIKQALLGNPTALGYFNPSWKFIDSDYVLSLPPNLYDVPTGYPQVINISISSDSFDNNFIGIKRGDVNGTCNPVN